MIQGPLVEGSWLAERLDDPTVRIVDLRAKEEYDKGHLKNAVNAPMSLLRTTINGIPGMAIGPREFEELLGRLGVSNDSTVVAYDDVGGLDAARLYWTLEHYGHERAHLLHGTTALWLAENRTLVGNAPAVEAVPYRATLQTSRVATLDQVRAALGGPGVVLVDARTPQEYAGQQAEQTGSTGHIPGAVNVEWSSHLETGDHKRLKTRHELLELYQSAGVTPDKEVIVYCRTAHRASHSYFVLRLLSYPRVRLYDGSWAEWSSRPELPVER